MDTNVVWNWHTYGKEIADNMDFDEQEVIAKIGQRGLEDIRGLSGLYQVGAHYGTIEFVTSGNTIQELSRKTRSRKGVDRLQWGHELLDWWIEQVVINYPDEDFSESQQRAQTWLDQNVFDFLPDSEDRLLVASGMAAHCGIFLTMDYKTILPYRHRIGELARLRVLRPSEWWEEVSRSL